MKERYQRTVREMLEEAELDWAIADRFKEERHPTRTVDGDDEWDRYDLFAEGED